MHHHLDILHLRKGELNQLYLSIAMRYFSLSMIGIFIPIYLIQVGFSIASVFVFFTMLTLVHAIGCIPAGYIAAKFGYKHNMLFSVPLMIAGFFLLYSIDIFRWPLFLIAFCFGFNNSLFWTGYHSDFSKFSHKKKRASELGSAKIVASLFSVLGPLMGGVLLAFFGFKEVFVIVSVLLFLAVVPLMLTSDVHEKFRFSLKDLFIRRKIRDSFSLIGFGFERVAAGIIWPIFIFYFVFSESFTEVGLVSSLSLLFSFVFIFVIGKFSDGHKRRVLRIGAFANMIVWIVKGSVRTGFQVFFIDSVYGLTHASADISFDAISYDKANKENIMSYMVYREFMINLGRALLCGIMIFVSDLTFGLVTGGGIGSLLMMLF